MITLKVNMTTSQNYYTQTLTVKCIKLKLKMSTKILATIKKCFMSIIMQLSQNTMIIQTN